MHCSLWRKILRLRALFCGLLVHDVRCGVRGHLFAIFSDYSGAGNASVDPNAASSRDPSANNVSKRDDDVGYAEEEQLDESDHCFCYSLFPWRRGVECIYQPLNGGTRASEVVQRVYDQHCYLFDNLPPQTADKMECPLGGQKFTTGLWKSENKDFIVEEGSSYEEFVEEAGKRWAVRN